LHLTLLPLSYYMKEKQIIAIAVASLSLLLLFGFCYLCIVTSLEQENQRIEKEAKEKIMQERILFLNNR
jgi:hypothetical protein